MLINIQDAGVDISLLTKALSSQEQVMEKDEAWEFDSLFVTVTSELQQEFEEEENRYKVNCLNKDIDFFCRKKEGEEKDPEETSSNENTNPNGQISAKS